MRPQAWDEVLALGEAFTCYSSAMAAWAAADREDWRLRVDSGLHLSLVEAGDGLFGFSHFPPGAATALGLVRHGSDDAGTALEAVRDELMTAGRVIVTADGHNLPWHVAHGRAHVPHWFALVLADGAPLVLDPFDCRTEHGPQRPSRHTTSWDELPPLLAGLPGDDPVLALREDCALGPPAGHEPRAFGWLTLGAVSPLTAPSGALDGPDALRRLARHFREHGAEPEAYRQADDLWAIARHRTFHAHRVAAIGEGDPGAAAWAAEHLQPLVARWGHVAPLILQARMAIGAGRAPQHQRAGCARRAG